jgi:hypothetical protein
MPAATAAVIEASPAERAGIASGVLNAARQAGGAIGAVVTAVWVDRRQRRREQAPTARAATARQQ